MTLVRRNLHAWALVTLGMATSTFGADQVTESPTPLAAPTQSTMGTWRAAQHSEANPQRPVPLLNGLLADPIPREYDPTNIVGNSVPSPTPSAVVPNALVAAEERVGELKAPANALDRRVDEAISVTARRTLSIDTHTPWQIGHGMLAYRRNYVLRDGEKLINAYDWVATNPTYLSQTTDPQTNAPTRPLPWFYLTKHGARPQAYTGLPYEFEGHPNQFLAFFAMARIPTDFQFMVEGRPVTFGQMLYNAKMEINDREEVTWDLWAFAYYFDMSDRWTNAQGQSWSMERLVSTTMNQLSPTRSPCGGCHALFAIASARNAFIQTPGSRMTGVWTQAHMQLEKHIALAKSMQNTDGSFSSNYFKGPGYSSDPSKRISTTGHTLEFLMVALPQNRLQEPWVAKAVESVSRDLIDNQDEPIDVGGMYHAAHALVLYRERTRQEFVVQPQTPSSPTAASPRNERSRR